MGASAPRKPAAKLRLDQLLVERGLADSRSRAQALVMAGKVFAAAALAGLRPSIPIAVGIAGFG